MNFPTIADYLDAVTNPYGRFRHLTEVEVARNGYDEPIFCTGNDAVVFRMHDAEGDRANGKSADRALKCYTRLPEHFEAVYDFLATVQSAHLLPVERFSEEIYLHDAYDRGYRMPVVWMPWVEGPTLGQAVRGACRNGDRAALRRMAEAFDRLSAWLQEQPFAHGDLKHDNLLFDEAGELLLVDYDAMYVPALAGCICAQIGSPAYQHPDRDAACFGKQIDDYPMALIAVSLWALVDDPALHARYNDGENLILNPTEIAAGTSPLYDALLERFAAAGDERLVGLCRSLRIIGN